jgi:hypothetical protein
LYGVITQKPTVLNSIDLIPPNVNLVTDIITELWALMAMNIKM